MDRGVQLTDDERVHVCAVLMAWLGRFGCEADPRVTSALFKMVGVDKRVWIEENRQ